MYSGSGSDFALVTSQTVHETIVKYFVKFASEHVRLIGVMYETMSVSSVRPSETSIVFGTVVVRLFVARFRVMTANSLQGHSYA